MLIHKTEKVKNSIYKRPQIWEIEKESMYCESRFQENDFAQEKNVTFAYKFNQDKFIYLKDDKHPSKLIQIFADKTILKSIKKRTLKKSLKRIEDTS